MKLYSSETIKMEKIYNWSWSFNLKKGSMWGRDRDLKEKGYLSNLILGKGKGVYLARKGSGYSNSQNLYIALSNSNIIRLHTLHKGNQVVDKLDNFGISLDSQLKVFYVISYFIVDVVTGDVASTIFPHVF